MPRRKHKKYSRPRKMFDKATIVEENNLIKKYGLKNRREVWKASFAIERIRRIAKTLITADEKDKESFINRQIEKGFDVKSIQDILALSKEDYLKRRLQSIIFSKKLAKTAKQARQLITHRHVKIKGNIINIPSHLTTLEQEKDIGLDISVPIKEERTEEENKFLEKIKSTKEEENE